MKPIFKHREAIQLAHEMEHNNTYANALIAENKRLREEAEHLTPTSSAIMVLQYESDRSELLHKNANLICDNQRLKAEVVELRAERNQARCDCTVAENNHMNAVEQNNVLRNELCYKCGRYKEAHNGACNGCKWKKEDTANDK